MRYLADRAKKRDFLDTPGNIDATLERLPLKVLQNVENPWFNRVPPTLVLGNETQAETAV
jgi:hypothetical protein